MHIVLFIVIQCPNNWIDAGLIGCYYIPKKGPFYSWRQAQSFCKNLAEDAGLAEIHDGETHGLLRGFMIAHDYWIGGNSVAPEHARARKMPVRSQFLMIEHARCSNFHF